MAILLIGMMPSCTYDTILVGGLNEHANVTLSLKLGEQPIVESRLDGDVSPEDAISTVELFFYEADATSSDVAFHYVSNEEITNNGGILTFSMPADVLDNYCDDGDNCKVYAIVNRDDETELPKTYDKTSLEQMVLDAAFVNDNKQPQTPNSFVMHGWDTEVTRAGNVLDGEIHVQRVAAKITLDFIEYNKDTNGNIILNSDGTYKVTPVTMFTVTENGITYTADLTDVEIALRRGISRSYLGSVYNGTDKKDYLFDTSYVYYKSETTGNDNVSTYTINNTFYTYPTNWAGDENSRTYLALKITWDSESGPVDTYYGINVNPAASNLASNNHYHILQAISVLGSTDEEEPVILEDPRSYQVVDWGTKDSSGKLELANYLVVDETNIVLQNVETKNIYFSSSDPIELTDVTVKWNYTGQETAVDLTMATKTNATRSVVNKKDIQYVISNSSKVSNVNNRIQGDYKVTITIHNADATVSNDRSYILVEHNLDNSMTDGADYTAYTIEFSVAHQDNSDYNESVTITQYPMLYIEAKLNSDFGQDGDANNNTANGYVYINNDNGESWAGKRTLDVNNNMYNHNPNRYLITISSLANTTVAQKYIVGDPRSATSTPPTNIYSGLTTYYPTSDSGTKNMVSPQFMVASSYGVCPSNITSLNDAIRRCATYQEDGYPAGRWRVPTQAEIQYIIQLSGWGMIPALFNTGIGYWSAQGLVGVDDYGKVDDYSDASTKVVRCVYDTWYWGTEAPLTGNAKKTFTYMN